MFSIRKQSHVISCAVIVALSSISGAALATSGLDDPIRVHTDGLQPNVAKQVRAHADESMRSLMQYLWFTRKYHNLWIEDVTAPKTEPQLATAPEAKREKVVLRTTGQH